MKDNAKTYKPEILAPAGTYEAMQAAVNAGCDAVYMGGNMFGARAYAGNFGSDEMIRALDYCHMFDVRVYMTVNTLMKENEVALLPDYIKPFYQAGLDGVIVQDMGAVKILKEEFPELNLHASTQLSISSEYGARLMKRLGLVRIVPARELSLKEIADIKEKVDIEIESFVHGAMCYAYSGKCLFSSFFGGRSGNRGRCAQPCRQKYVIENFLPDEDKPHVKAEKPYILSLKDMCTLEQLGPLIDAGIDSFKIEGRMKNPYYVAAAVNAYKTARDKYLDLTGAGNDQRKTWDDLKKTDKDEYLGLAGALTEEMQDIYNRGGFHSGYYFTDKGLVMTADARPNHEGLDIGTIVSVKGPKVGIKLIRDVNTGDVLEIKNTGIELTSGAQGKKGTVLTVNGKELKKIKPGMKVFRTRNNVLLKNIEESIIKPERKIEAFAFIEAKVGKPLKVTISDGSQEITITQTGNTVERAGNHPVTKERLYSQMNKTGGTNLNLCISGEVDDDAFVAMSDFNNVRRLAMERFSMALSSRYHRQ